MIELQFALKALSGCGIQKIEIQKVSDKVYYLECYSGNMQINMILKELNTRWLTRFIAPSVCCVGQFTDRMFPLNFMK